MNLLCVVDDSPAGRHVANVAGDIASRLQAQVSVVTAGGAQQKSAVTRKVSRQIRAATRRGSRLDVEFSRRIGRPAKELDRAATQINPAIVVVGADARSAWRSRGARAAREVLRRGRHPVVIVGAQPQRSTPALEDEQLRLAA